MTERDRGREVYFQPPWSPRERGSLCWWNETYAFVRYQPSRRVYATAPEFLAFTRSAPKTAA